MDEQKLTEYLHFVIDERKSKPSFMWDSIKPLRVTKTFAKHLLLENVQKISGVDLYGFLIKDIGLDVYEITVSKKGEDTKFLPK